MRRSGLPAPKPQDVCIFCSSRWILLPTSTPSPSRPSSRPRLQRRYFTSGKAAHVPPATATATATVTATATAQAESRSQKKTRINGSRMDREGAGAGASAFPQNAGGWAQKKNYLLDFGVKKKEVINPDSALLNSALSDSLAGGRGARESAGSFPLPQSQNHQGRTNSFAATIVGEKAVAEANGTRPGENLNGAPLWRAVNGTPFDQGKWTCRSCGHMNTDETRCKKCQSLNFTFLSAAQASEQDRKGRQTWKHLKFIGSMDAAKPIQSIDPDVESFVKTPSKFDQPHEERLAKPIQSIDPDGKSSIKTTSKLDQSREERLSQTKDGQFVGFGSSAAPVENSPPSAGFKIRFTVGRAEEVAKSEVLTRIQRLRSQRGQVTPAHAASTQPDKGYSRAKQRKQSRFVSKSANKDDGDDGDMWDKIEKKRMRKKERERRKAAAPPTSIMLPEYISVANLAIALRVPLDRFGAKMDELGFVDTNHDHILDAETAGLIAAEFNYEPTTITPDESHDIRARPPIEDKSLLPTRPPVVTIMGHVDHGKTTLLDWLRKSSVAASEHGGITQHIGAFSVSMPSGRLITFLDTPGHAAFLDMRQRGANVTDIVILVVAADDSVKPQTLEALKHAQAATVPIIVAINKIDKEGVDVDRVKKDLARHGVEIEDYGGDTQAVPISGKTGQGMLALEEAVIALADLLDVRAEKDGAAEGWVLEATKRKAGRAATVLVSRGTVRPGDIIVAGSTWTKARTLRDASGARVLAAGPGTPVEVDGWREQPKAGDQVLQAKSEMQAKSAVDYRIEVAARNQMAADMAALNAVRRAELQRRERKWEEENRQQQQQLLQEDTGDESGSGSGESEPSVAISQPGTKDVFFIIKADVSGSVEAVLNSVCALATSEVRPQIISSGVGPVTEFEIDHVAMAGGHILSFNLDLEPSMIRRADLAGVEIVSHNIIYRLVDDVKARLIEYLPPIVTQRVVGEAEIARIFQYTVKQKSQVPFAGCKVRNGIIKRKEKVRVMRKGKEVYTGTMSSMKQVKKDVTEMHKGTECGLGFENWTEFQVGDLVQSYEEKVEKRTSLS